MKAKLAALLAVLLLLTACAAPAPESDGAPPEPESLSDPEPEVKDVSHYYVDGYSHSNGIEDKEAVQALYWYLRGNLTPREYCSIDFYDLPKEIYAANDPRAFEDNESVYLVGVYGPDRAPIDALLREYDGPWAPIWFDENDRTFYDLMQAEEYAKAFFYEHPEVAVTAIEFDGELVRIVLGEQVPAELTAYLSEYPIEYIFIVSNGRGANPD